MQRVYCGMKRLGGNARADRFAELVLPHVSALHRAAYRLLRNADDAEDAVQDVLTKLFPKVDTLEAIDALRPWLLRVLRRHCIDVLRRRGFGEELLAARQKLCLFTHDEQGNRRCRSNEYRSQPSRCGRHQRQSDIRAELFFREHPVLGSRRRNRSFTREAGTPGAEIATHRPGTRFMTATCAASADSRRAAAVMAVTVGLGDTVDVRVPTTCNLVKYAGDDRAYCDVEANLEKTKPI